MIRSICAKLKAQWKPLLATDVLFKAVAFVVLTPCVTLLFHLFLSTSGRTILADVDIARFLFHPLGWLASVVVGGTTLGILALEQSVLMTLSLSATYSQPLGIDTAFLFVLKSSRGVLSITVRMVARLLLLATPFLIVAGGLYLLLLTKHDINYYLSERPPQFWIAVVSIGMTLLCLVIAVVRCVVNWSLAIQLHLFERVSPGECLHESRRRVFGHRKAIAIWIIAWMAIQAIIHAVGTGLVVGLGHVIVPPAASQIWTLIFSIGFTLSLWMVVNLACTFLAVISFALLQAEIYDKLGRSANFHLPDDARPPQPAWAPRWTPRLTFWSAVAVICASGAAGLTAIHSVRLEDATEITAHRGASGSAPENTLAAVREAIEAGADWVEIDVQESKEGVVVVAHDSDLKKLSGSDAKIWELTLDELRQIDIGSRFGPEFSGERVPTLEQVLDVCRGRVGLNIELKYYGHDQDLERKVVQLVEARGMQDDVLIMSLEARGIERIKRLRPDWTVGLLIAVAAGDLTNVDADFLAVNTGLATRRLIVSAHNKGKRVFVWTVNDPIQMSIMISRGADNIITDYPELGRHVLAERAKMSPIERILIDIAFLFGVNTRR